MFDTPHPVFVLAAVALLGTVGLEYGIGSAVLATSTVPQPLDTVLDDTPASLPSSPTATTSPADTVASPRERESEPPGVRMAVGRVESCGSTCRDVTAHLYNEETVDLTNVEVYTTIYAGDEIVWVDAERAGTIAAGDVYTTTKRVNVGPGEISKIHSNGGSVTVETVIEFDQGSTVVTENVDVV
ncbi:P-loop NTPase family protein [Halogranum rubrum]|uniref:Uncharacterized protein n=1 Tax=Halogranum salarium B-1 TaxID=1210908 RepID=J2ZVU9_9EURY|nr:hypothetical protein [Halogranum salarium]EJN57153.1 hypothetical protein HSB1_45390 [Halogranum salarium B-1]